MPSAKVEWQTDSSGRVPDLLGIRKAGGCGRSRLVATARIPMANKAGRSSKGEFNPLALGTSVFRRPFGPDLDVPAGLRGPNADKKRGTFSTLVEAVEMGYMSLDDLGPKERRRVARILSPDTSA